MPRVRLVHPKASEAGAVIEALRAAGHTVEYDEKLTGNEFRAVRQSPPDVFVIDLSRVPSHGRELAIYFRGQKALRQVPMVFVEGAPEKVAEIRKLLPDAVYTTGARLRSAVRQALAAPPANPVVPPQMMERYRSRTAAQKLGIREDSTVALIDPPRNYVAALGELPSSAVLDEDPAAKGDVTLWFVHDAEACLARLPRMRGVAERTKLWILWRKGSQIKEPFLRESAIAVGLVDYKICAVDATWSAMAFARKQAKEKH